MYMCVFGGKHNLFVCFLACVCVSSIEGDLIKIWKWWLWLGHPRSLLCLHATAPSLNCTHVTLLSASKNGIIFRFLKVSWGISLSVIAWHTDSKLKPLEDPYLNVLISLYCPSKKKKKGGYDEPQKSSSEICHCGTRAQGHHTPSPASLGHVASMTPPAGKEARYLRALSSAEIVICRAVVAQLSDLSKKMQRWMKERGQTVPVSTSSPSSNLITGQFGSRTLLGPRVKSGAFGSRDPLRFEIWATAFQRVEKSHRGPGPV